MSATATKERTTSPTTAQECPACDGLNPPESVRIGAWRTVSQGGVPVGMERKVSFECDCCGFKTSRTESRHHTSDMGR